MREVKKVTFEMPVLAKRRGGGVSCNPLATSTLGEDRCREVRNN
jgi:hypothetical protein